MRSTDRPFRIQLLAALGGVALILAACSSSGASTAPSAARLPRPPRTAPSTATGGETYAVAVASGAVGAYLTGEDGKTLYIFTPDSKDSEHMRRRVRDEVAAASPSRPTTRSSRTPE